MTSSTGFGNYTNLVNPQVYDHVKGLACGWKWMCQDPNCGDSQWPRNRCSCCDLCDGDENDTPDDGGEYDSEPCCYNGNCCPCKAVSGDAPPLFPQSIGCGRRHICKTIKTLPLCEEQLDIGDAPNNYADLPGRPPHTIVCVRATGSSIVQLEDCMQDNGEPASPTNPLPPPPNSNGRYNDLTLLNANCNAYDLWVRFKIPLEVIVRDCAGYLYCLKSFLTELVRIPLTARIKNLGTSWIYAKVRVRLCYPNAAEAVPMFDEAGAPMGQGPTFSAACTATAPGCSGSSPSWRCIASIANNHFRRESANNVARCLIDEDLERDCHYKYTFGTYPCEDRGNGNRPILTDRCNNGNPKLDILIEACVVRLVPGGLDGDNNGNYMMCYQTPPTP